MFLNKTPTVDNLEINPVPDIIIKTWYDSILVGVRNYFPENEFSKQKLEAEFNRTLRQLEYERDVWKSGKGRGQPKNIEAENSIDSLTKLLKAFISSEVEDSYNNSPSSRFVSRLESVKE